MLSSSPESTPKSKTACVSCRKLHSACDFKRPCKRCFINGIECIDPAPKSRKELPILPSSSYPSSYPPASNTVIPPCPVRSFHLLCNKYGLIQKAPQDSFELFNLPPINLLQTLLIDHIHQSNKEWVSSSIVKLSENPLQQYSKLIRIVNGLTAVLSLSVVDLSEVVDGNKIVICYLNCTFRIV